MLLEAAIEDEAALLPPQYQTNYREEFQYSGLHTGQYVSHMLPALSCDVQPPTPPTARVPSGCIAQPCTSMLLARLPFLH